MKIANRVKCILVSAGVVCSAAFAAEAYMIITSLSEETVIDTANFYQSGHSGSYAVSGDKVIINTLPHLRPEREFLLFAIRHRREHFKPDIGTTAIG